jgi:protein-S-isoprenylcysteine O-methyltransferase Ste14
MTQRLFINEDRNRADQRMEDTSLTPRHKMTERLLDGMGYLVPLFQSIPYGYLLGMSTPFILYLLGIVITAPVTLVGLPGFLVHLIFGGFPLELAISMIGFFLLVSSIVYLKLNKARSPVTEGPYRFIRHPQYLGVLMFTLSLTTRSVWLTTHTFGLSYFTAEMAIAIWYAEMFAYVFLAVAEEQHLLKHHPEKYAVYMQKSAFLIPFPGAKRRWVHVILSLIVLALLLHGTILLYQNTWGLPFQLLS